MDMVERICLVTAVGAVGVTLTWVIHRVLDQSREIKELKAGAITERNSVRYELRGIKMRFAEFRDDIMVRLMIKESIKDGDPMIRSIFHSEEG